MRVGGHGVQVALQLLEGFAVENVRRGVRAVECQNADMLLGDMTPNPFGHGGTGYCNGVARASRSFWGLRGGHVEWGPAWCAKCGRWSIQWGFKSFIGGSNSFKPDGRALAAADTETDERPLLTASREFLEARQEEP